MQEPNQANVCSVSGGLPLNVSKLGSSWITKQEQTDPFFAITARESVNSLFLMFSNASWSSNVPYIRAGREKKRKKNKDRVHKINAHKYGQDHHLNGL